MLQQNVIDIWQGIIPTVCNSLQKFNIVWEIVKFGRIPGKIYKMFANKIKSLVKFAKAAKMLFCKSLWKNCKVSKSLYSEEFVKVLNDLINLMFS